MSERVKRASIRDVARLAGVSSTTVSHVLNDVAGARVADETRERVREASERLGYRPSRVARGLRLQRTHALGMVSDHLATTPHAGEMLLGAQEAALERDYHVVLINTGDDPARERGALDVLGQMQVDGLIYATMYHRIVDPPTLLPGVAAVLMDCWAPGRGLPGVVPDEVAGGRVATEELIRLGHRRIGLVTSIDDIPATRGRLRGYRQALADAGIRFLPSLVVAEESVGTDGGFRGARRLLSRRNPPTALFCFNDRVAMGAYRAAAELGLRIPTDVSIVGFDDQQIIAAGLAPPLTTVALPHYAMGAWAVNTLVDLIDGTAPRGQADEPTLLPCPLVRRKSAAGPHHQ